MSYYRKIPVLDEKEQLEFDKYLTDQYQTDLELAYQICKGSALDEENQDAYTLAVFDKLATPRIYLLQAWIHRRAQEAAGVENRAELWEKGDPELRIDPKEKQK